MYDGENIEWGRANGVTIITMDEFAEQSIADVMKQARHIVGDQPTYVSLILTALILPCPRNGNTGNWRLYTRGSSGAATQRS